MQLPFELIKSLQHVPGFDNERFVQVHEFPEQIVSVRFNPLKPTEALRDFADRPVPWCRDGFYLTSRPFFTFDPYLHAGAYYVQEASSMFLEQAFTQLTDSNAPLRVLDLCAAPGGKSTLLQSLLNDQSLLVSNEVIRGRVNILSENMTKWGYANGIVTSNDAKDFQRLPGFFDVMVVDAPCSGSGLFRRDEKAISEWSPANVALCSERQQRILANALPALKEGGILIYSTCSYSMQEDEETADWLVAQQSMESVSLTIDPAWCIVESRAAASNAAGYRFYPDKLKGEGFFIACFRKMSGEEEFVGKSSKLDWPSKQERPLVESFVADPLNLLIWKLSDRFLAISSTFEEDLKSIVHRMYVRKAGVSIGKLAGKDLLPDHELALSRIAAPGIPSISLKKEMALQYLRREEVKINTSLRGWVMAEYEGVPLGWMKVLPNRVNNYYPKEWRILKGSSN